MALENEHHFRFYKRTACAVVVLSLLAGMPAMAQVIIGGDGGSGIETSVPHSGPPAWLLQYAEPAVKKKTEPTRKAKAVPKKVKPAAVLEAPQRRPVVENKKQKPLIESPWSPRAQATDQSDLFPELTKKKEEALMVAPQLGGAKMASTRGETTLPAVLTPNLMDSMVQAARDDADVVPVQTEGERRADLAVASATSGEENMAEGAYSPVKAGTADKYVLGKAGAVAPVADKKAPRKLFSSNQESVDNQVDNKKTSTKLLADMNREPVPTPQDKSQEPLLPATPPPTPAPGSQSLGTLANRRDDELTIPEKAPTIDSLQPLEGMDDEAADAPLPVVTPPAEGRRLIASLSDTKPDVLPEKPAAIIEQPKVSEPQEITVSVDAPTDQPAPEPVAEKAPAVASAVTEEIDITQMVSAPRLLGRASDTVANTAPTPRAMPVAKVETVVPEVKVEASAPEVKVETSPVAETRSLLTLEKEETPVPANILTVPDKAAAVPDMPVQPSKVVKAPEKPVKKAVKAVKPTPQPAPEIKVEVPPEVKVETPTPIAKDSEVKITVPEVAPEVEVTVPSEPVDVMAPLPKVAAAPAPSAPVNILRAPEPKPQPAAPIPLARIEPAAPAAPVMEPPRVVMEEPAMPEQRIIAPADVAPVAPSVASPLRQTITPPPNLRVETPAGGAGAPRLRTPRLVPDVPADAPRDVTDVAAPLATVTPETAAPVAEPANDTTPNAGRQTVYFAPDTKDLDEASKQQVDNLADELEENPDARVTLTAYADAELVVEARRMALARALAIRSRLAKAGIQPARIDVKAVGQKPANENGVADRVDVVVR